MTERLRRVTRALLSVSDKTGLIDFARALSGRGGLQRRTRATGDFGGCTNTGGGVVRDLVELDPAAVDDLRLRRHLRVAPLLAHVGNEDVEAVVRLDLL
jgi:hypothetical protein